MNLEGKCHQSAWFRDTGGIGSLHNRDFRKDIRIFIAVIPEFWIHNTCWRGNGNHIHQVPGCIRCNGRRHRISDGAANRQVNNIREIPAASIGIAPGCSSRFHAGPRPACDLHGDGIGNRGSQNVGRSAIAHHNRVGDSATRRIGCGAVILCHAKISHRDGIDDHHVIIIFITAAIAGCGIGIGLISRINFGIVFIISSRQHDCIIRQVNRCTCRKRIDDPA